MQQYKNQQVGRARVSLIFESLYVTLLQLIKVEEHQKKKSGTLRVVRTMSESFSAGHRGTFN